jgi:hypothetical protein
MDLKQSFQTAIDELDARQIRLDTQQAELKAKEMQLGIDRKSFEEKKHEIDAKIKEYGGIVEAERIKAEYEEKMANLTEEIRKNTAKRVELIGWENKLYGIEQRQEKKDTELAERETRLNKEKETYKEELKKNFVEALKQYLPQ